MRPLAPALTVFSAGVEGEWRVDRIEAIVGEGLPLATRLMAKPSGNATAPTAQIPWSLRGIISNARYIERQELDGLEAVQEGLGRPQATRAALIPIRKTEAWWSLAQDERRRIFEEQSHHIRIGLEYLPSVARRLYHSRELGEAFDFLTWFEYAPSETEAFEALVRRLRTTPEWAFVDREVDIRLIRDSDR